MRLDQYLVDKGLVESRERGKALIMAGLVYLDNQKAEKPGQPVAGLAHVEIRGEACPYVSRGGLKLEKALSVFEVSPENRICMDIGASTGGFTDCLLQHGAAKVYAVDVGYGQLAWKLRGDKRVHVMERTNIRNIDCANIEDIITLFTIDVAFISIKHVLPVITSLSNDQCEAICLVKPQFEAGKENVGKNGVVKDADVHLNVLNSALRYANSTGMIAINASYSPIQGPKGNIEFLLHLTKTCAPQPPQQPLLEQVVRQAHLAFEQP